MRSRSLFLISRFIEVETQGRLCLVLDILDGMLFFITLWIPSLKNDQLLFTVISLTFLAKNWSDISLIADLITSGSAFLNTYTLCAILFTFGGLQLIVKSMSK